jgi:3',5'-cyclic AMP phosphodiesterase CpdA
MLRIAHVSDFHLPSPLGIEWRGVIFNKRLTGLTNLLLHRARRFNAQYLSAVLNTAATHADCMVVTGDLTNLSLESEYAYARRILDTLAEKVELTVIPGNHDLYVHDIVRRQRFSHYFERFMRSDLPGHSVHVPAGPFPFVRLRGPVSVIGLSSAVPRPPFVSAGYVGRAQIAALRSVLDDPQVNSRTPVVLVHHDPLEPRFRLEQLRRGLIDASSVRAAVSTLGRGMILSGHLHIRRYSRLTTETGGIDVVCASGASLEHPDSRIRAGFNLYTIENDGTIRSIDAWVLDPVSHGFMQYDLRTQWRIT